MKRSEIHWRSSQPPGEQHGVRHDLIARVRREIDAGTYDSPAKLEAALERMLAQIAQD